jgi:hypothetical protein
LNAEPLALQAKPIWPPVAARRWKAWAPLALTVFSFLALAAHSGLGVLMFLVALLGWAALLGCWFTWTSAFWRYELLSKAKPYAWPHRRRRLLLIPACFGLCFTLFATRTPEQLRFRLSQSALETAVAGDVDALEGRVGLYSVKRISRHDDVTWITTGYGLKDAWGVAWSPERKLEPLEELNWCRPLADGWYLWTSQ